MGPTWVLSAPDGTHVGPMNLAIREGTWDLRFVCVTWLMSSFDLRYKELVYSSWNIFMVSSERIHHCCKSFRTFVNVFVRYKFLWMLVLYRVTLAPVRCCKCVQMCHCFKKVSLNITYILWNMSQVVRQIIWYVISSSEWSTILLPSRLPLILEVLWYFTIIGLRQ